MWASCWTCLLQCVLWGFLLGMCIAMCGIGFPVGYVSCNVLCGASYRPGICKKQLSFHLELIVLWIPGRRILTTIQKQFFAACLLQCVVRGFEVPGWCGWVRLEKLLRTNAKITTCTIHMEPNYQKRAKRIQRMTGNQDSHPYFLIILHYHTQLGVILRSVCHFLFFHNWLSLHVIEPIAGQ